MSNEEFGLIFAAGTLTYAFSFLINGPLPHLSQIDAPTSWSDGQAPQASPDLGRCYRIAS